MVEGFNGRLGAEEERETVFLIEATVFLISGSEAGNECSGLDDDGGSSTEVLGGRPETRGGGSSRPSMALREI